MLLAAMSLPALGSKSGIDLWEDSENKTQCKMCDLKISGKNATNLKRRLNPRHPEIYKTVSEHHHRLRHIGGNLRLCNVTQLS